MPRQMLDTLQERLLIFNVAGRVVLANSAARAAMETELAGIERSPELLDGIRDLALDRRQAPLMLTLTLSGPLGMRAQPAVLSKLFNGTQFGLVLRGSQAEAGGGGGGGGEQIAPFVELLRSEALEPVRSLAERARQAAGELAGHGELAALCGELAERLGLLDDLSDVFGRDPVVGDERVSVPVLVRDVMVELAPQAAGQRVRLSAEGLPDEAAPVYGSRAWLQRALHECVHLAMLRARTACAPDAAPVVELRIAQTGDYMLVRVANVGATALPGGASAAGNAWAGAGDAGGAAPGAASGAAPGATGGLPRLGLSLAQRIVELHGGSVRVRQAGDGIDEVLIELPTGGRQRHDPQLDIEQAQRYAQDLARLLARKQKRESARGQTASA